MVPRESRFAAKLLQFTLIFHSLDKIVNRFRWLSNVVYTFQHRFNVLGSKTPSNRSVNLRGSRHRVTVDPELDAIYV